MANNAFDIYQGSIFQLIQVEGFSFYKLLTKRGIQHYIAYWAIDITVLKRNSIIRQGFHH